jgi:hypothetical protein
MSYESIILLENISTESVNFSYSDKKSGAGYYKRSDSTHTVSYSVDSFVGTIKLQATLELYPTDTDWFDVIDSSFGGDSTTSTTVISKNFTGNFVWIRAAYSIQNGSITTIRYNY